MEAAQKARELIEKMYHHGNIGTLTKRQAKQCALVCCDEIIAVLDLMELQERGAVIGGYNQDYWQQVKTFIENY